MDTERDMPHYIPLRKTSDSNLSDRYFSDFASDDKYLYHEKLNIVINTTAKILSMPDEISIIPLHKAIENRRPRLPTPAVSRSQVLFNVFLFFFNFFLSYMKLLE